jgi:hypothetical protein
MLSYEQLLRKPPAKPLPNNGLQATANSLRSYVAPAISGA